jgi:hypothetical protein
MCNGFLHSQNNIDAWHKGWENLIGSAYVSVYQIIEEFPKSSAMCVKIFCDEDHALKEK